MRFCSVITYHWFAILERYAPLSGMALLSDDICVVILLRSTNRLSSVEVCDFAIHEKAGT